MRISSLPGYVRRLTIDGVFWHQGIMTRSRRLAITKASVVLGTIPLLLWAHASGPDVGKSGVPGESTCWESGCHLGTPLNGGGGSVSVTFPNGMTYTPGIKQHLVVTISDPVQRVWGF